MNRAEFLEAACAWGLCSCAALAAHADQDVSEENSSEIDLGQLRYKLDFVTKRFAKLVQIMADTLDEQTMAGLFEAMGRQCALEFGHVIDPFRGKPEAFIEEIQRQWVEKADLDLEAGTLRIIDKARHCTCPFVDEKLMSMHFCHCSIGWQKQAYETIFGQPVDVEIEESILRGGKHCIFRVTTTPKV